MKKLSLLILGIFFLFGSSMQAATLYLVSNNGIAWSGLIQTPANTGFATVTPVNLSSLSQSFNAWFAATTLTSGDQVWIATGTYYLTGTVTLKTGVSIYGGFGGAETSISSRAKNSTDKWDFTNVTILDGSVSGTKTYIGFTGGFSTTTLVDGLTIQNCTNGATNSSGGAAKLTGTGTSIQNCIITNCTATGTVSTGASGGITLTGGSSLKDSYIHHNTSTASGTTAGGIVVYGNSCSVSGCKIEYNANSYSGGDGGGLFLYATTSGVNISNCSFSNNSARNGGGIGSYIASANNASPISITNCSFTSNTASGNGGGAYLSSTITSNVYNVSGCTFTSNTSAASTSATGNGGGGLSIGNGAFTIDKCTFMGNSTTLAYGGALTIPSASSCTISNSKFIGNTAGSTTSNTGSAIYCKSSYTANNCLFADNTGVSTFQFYTSTAVSKYQNCTFANNLTSLGAAAPISLLNIGTSPYPKYVFSNCLFYKVSGFSAQTSPTTTTCASDIALSTISINTITAADFVDANNGTILSRNYQLSPISLALNAGTDLSTATSPVTKDILDVTRPQGGAYDIGAYELPYYNTTVTFNANGTVNSYTTGDVDSKPQGTQMAYTITPSLNYQITSVLYNGTDVASSIVGNVYTTPALSGNSTLVVQFDMATSIEKSRYEMQCFAANHKLELRNAQVGKEISIYNIAGQKIHAERITSASFSLALPQGIYLIKTANENKKVVIK